MFYVYHESRKSSAARCVDVRPGHWIRQATCWTIEEARDVARNITTHRVHAKIASRQHGTEFVAGRPTH